MPLVDFYSAVAQMSFVMLGLWIVVIELGPDDLLTRRDLRRTVLHVSLGFLIPGIVSVGSLLAADSLVLWRVAFTLGGSVGAVSAARLAMSPDAVSSPVPRATWWFAAVVYALSVVVALTRPALAIGGTPFPALSQEGVLVTVQLVTGAFAAWRVFAMDR